MNKKLITLVAVLGFLAGLAVLSVFGPSAPMAYEIAPDKAVPVAIAASGDSAWAIVGNRVYFMSLKQRTSFPSGERNINVIDAEELE